MAKGKTYSVAVVLKARDFVSAALGKVGRALGRVGSGAARIAKGIGRALGGLFDKLPGVGVLVDWVKGAATALYGLVKAVSDAGSTFNDLAVRTGIGTRALQEVAYAADQAGVPLDELGASLQTMTRVVGKGVKTSQFRMLGRDAGSFVKALKGAKSPGEKFELVLSTMAAMPDATKRAAFASVFFGRSGVKLAAVAADGADGLRAMREEAQKLGLVMSDEDIARADEWGDTVAALEKSFDGLKASFGSSIIEAILPDLRELLAYFKANRKEVVAFVRDLGRSVGRGLVATVKAIVDAIGWIDAHGDDILSWAKTLAVILGGLAVVDLLGGLRGILGLAPAVGGALTAALGPIGIAVAAVAALVVGLAKLASMTPSDAKRMGARGMEHMAETDTGPAGIMSRYMTGTDWWKTERAKMATEDSMAAAWAAGRITARKLKSGAGAGAAGVAQGAAGGVAASQHLVREGSTLSAGLLGGAAAVPIDLLVRVQTPDGVAATTDVKAPHNVSSKTRTSKTGAAGGIRR